MIALFANNNIYSQNTVNLDKALKEIAVNLNNKLPARTIVAIVNINSGHQKLSYYIIDELNNNIVNLGNLTIVERQNLNLIQNEMDFQFSGEVSDESVQSISKKWGAQTIILGEIFLIDNIYRLRIKAVSVETAAFQVTMVKNVKIDNKLRVLIGEYKNISLGIGGGLYLGGVFKNGTYQQNKKITAFTPDNGKTWKSADTLRITESINEEEFDIGANIFFDLIYAEINMSVFKGIINNNVFLKNEYILNNSIIHYNNTNKRQDISRTFLNIGFFGKYPFVINKFTLFPVMGMEYQLWLTDKINNFTTSNEISGNNSFWIKFGGGVDYEINRFLFLRGTFLWGIKINSKYERNDNFNYFTHSPSMKIGLGYKF